MSKPRYYQRQAIARGDFALEDHKRIIIAIGTGGGKTFVGSKLVSMWLPGRTLWLADQDELCTQPRQSISRFGGIIPALEKSSVRASKQAEVVVGSAQTLAKKYRREEWHPDHFDNIIGDEFHRGTDRCLEIANYFGKARVVGLTATPFRKDLLDFSKHYEAETVFSFPLYDQRGKNGLIQKGFAPPMTLLKLPVEIDLSKVKETKRDGEKDLGAEDLDTTIAPHYEEICRLLFEHCKGRRILVFLPLIRSSRAFVAIARQAGFTAQHVDSSSSDREEIIQGFAEGRFEMLCNAGVISTGVDIPPADCFVNLRPTRSFTWYQQAVGRVARPLAGVIDDLTEEDQAAERKERIAASAKPNFIVVDFLYQHDQLCKHAGHLIADNEEDAQRIFDKSKVGEIQHSEIIAKKVQAEREKALVKRLEYAAAKVKTFTPDSIALLTGDFELRNYDPINAWELKPAHPNQIEKLTHWGIEVDGVNRGMANLLIRTMIDRFQRNMATLKQLRMLHNLGLKQIETLTFNEASYVINRSRK